MNDNNFIQWFRNASPYINTHRGKTFVIMLPGQCINHENFHLLVNDIALLNSLGIKLVLVHGAQPQIESALENSQLDSVFQNGLRITEENQMGIINRVVGALKIEVEAALSAGLPNAPLHGSHIRVISGNFITAMPQGVIEGVDLHYTGKVRRVDCAGISSALDNNAVVLISNLGVSLTGEIFNLSYEDIATAVASSLGADKIIGLVDGVGVVDESDNLQQEFNLLDCENLISIIPKDDHSVCSNSLRACFNACRSGVPRGHLISYLDNGALLEELFSRDGAGTMIYGDSYETLRQATIDDVGGILELLEPMEEQGVLVRRSRELLETEINQFHVIEKDGAIIACAALYIYGEEAGELACVATKTDYRNNGRGALLLKNIEKIAIRSNLRSLFVLTTQTAHWFIEHGFREGNIEALPSPKKELYNYQRKSKVFVKQLIS